MAEWLRRQTWNLVGYARVGSNPAAVASKQVLRKPACTETAIYNTHTIATATLILNRNSKGQDTLYYPQEHASETPAP